MQLFLWTTAQPHLHHINMTLTTLFYFDRNGHFPLAKSLCPKPSSILINHQSFASFFLITFLPFRTIVKAYDIRRIQRYLFKFNPQLQTRNDHHICHEFILFLRHKTKHVTVNLVFLKAPFTNPGPNNSLETQVTKGNMVQNKLSGPQCCS